MIGLPNTSLLPPKCSLSMPISGEFEELHVYIWRDWYMSWGGDDANVAAFAKKCRASLWVVEQRRLR